jgi:hypothetical protein
MRSVRVLGWVRAGRGWIAACLALACALAFASSPALAAGPPETPETQPASVVGAHVATLNGLVNPKGEDGQAGTYEFLYRASPTECKGGSTTSPGLIYGPYTQGANEPVSGLTPHTTYTFCLVAHNEANETSVGPPETFTTIGPPEAPETLAATTVTATSALLHGVLNPNGKGETGLYEFLYRASATECAGGKSTPQRAGPATAQSVSESLTGLLPRTTYTFCLLDRNGGEETAVGSPLTFTTEPAAPTILGESVTEDTADGATLNAQIDPGGTETTYHFQYGTTADYGQNTPETFLFASDDNEHRAAVVLQGLQPNTVYHYRVVAINPKSPPGGTLGADETFVTEGAGTTFALPDGRAWELVSPANKSGAEIQTYFIGYGGDLQASENGDAVTYIASAPVGAGGRSNPIETQVLSRRGAGGWSSENLDTQHNEAGTIENGNALQPAFGQLGEYRVFSPDLSLAYVEPEGHTQLGSTPVVKGGNEEEETYIRNNETGIFTATTLTVPEWYAEQVALADGPPSCNASTAPDHEAEIDAISQNGCYVYFNAEGGAGQLYVAHEENGEWTTTPLPNLNGKVRWHLAQEDVLQELWAYGPGQELSPNGRYLAFMSNASLTGYDNRDAKDGALDQEVYLYDAATNHLVCVSCSPTGARETGVFDHANSTWEGDLLVDRIYEWPEETLAGSLADWIVRGQSKPLRQPRYLSNSGRLFFNSPVALVPEDVNGLEDVYEYEPAGAVGEGDCNGESATFSQASAGCVSLISAGTSGQESALIEASASGDDVFFLTSSPLASQDRDSGYDVYDAHVCSAGVPCPPPSLLEPPPCDTSDSCKPAPSPQPTAFGAPASATFSGSGNVAPQVQSPALKKAKKKKKKIKVKKRPKGHPRKQHKSHQRNQRRGK